MLGIHIYFVIYLALLILTVIELINKISTKIRNIIYVCVWIFLASFTGTRVCTGGDWIEYGNMFNRESQGEFEIFSDSGHEPIFRLIAHLSSNLGLTFEHFLLIIALSTSYLVARSFYVIMPKRIFLLTLLYYSVALFNQQFLLIRSGLAAAIFIYGIAIYLQNNNKKYLSLGIIASLIHKSSLIPFVIGYIANRKLSKIYLVIILFISFVGSYFRDYVFMALTFAIVMSGTNYANYIELGGAYTEGGKIINTAYLALLFLFVYMNIQFGPVYLKVAMRKRMSNKVYERYAMNSAANFDKNRHIFISIAIIFVAINISLPFHGIISRFNIYLLMPLWIFMVHTSNISNRYLGFILNIFLFSYTLISILTIVSSPDLFIFQKYQSWLLDSSLTFASCSTDGQY
jgi:hypothetical protein